MNFVISDTKKTPRKTNVKEIQKQHNLPLCFKSYFDSKLPAFYLQRNTLFFSHLTRIPQILHRKAL